MSQVHALQRRFGPSASTGKRQPSIYLQLIFSVLASKIHTVAACSAVFADESPRARAADLFLHLSSAEALTSLHVSMDRHDSHCQTRFYAKSLSFIIAG